ATKDNKEGGDHDVRDDWASFPLSVIDHVQHGKCNKSCMEHLHLLHEGPWLRINLKIVHLNYFAGMTKHSHKFVIKEEIKFVNISKVRKQAPLFLSNFAHGQRCTRKKKLIFRSSMKFSFQRIQDQ